MIYCKVNVFPPTVKKINLSHTVHFKKLYYEALYHVAVIFLYCVVIYNTVL